MIPDDDNHDNHHIQTRKSYAIGKVNVIGPYTSQSAQERNSNCSLIKQIAQISVWSVLRVDFTAYIAHYKCAGEQLPFVNQVM